MRTDSLANGGSLPGSLSDLAQDYLELGQEDRSLIWGIHGNREIDASVQKFPTLLRYALVRGNKEAIVHQVPDSKGYRDLVWQRLSKGETGWTLAGGADSGSYSQLAAEVEALDRINSGP